MIVFRHPFLIVALGVMWMILQDSYSLDYFLAGLLIGGLVLLIFPGEVEHYPPLKWAGIGDFFRWLVKAVHLGVYFMWEILLSNWLVAKFVVDPKMPVKPGIVRMQLKAESPGQITLLVAMITLTPGTVALDVSSRQDALYIHTIDASDEESVLAVPRRFEEMVMEVIP